MSIPACDDHKPVKQKARLHSKTQRYFGAITALIAGVLAFLGAAGKVFYMINHDGLLDSERMFFMSIPIVAAAAISIVLLLEHREGGEVSFKFIGMELRGKGSPVLLWVVTFLSIIGAVKLIF